MLEEPDTLDDLGSQCIDHTRVPQTSSIQAVQTFHTIPRYPLATPPGGTLLEEVSGEMVKSKREARSFIVSIMNARREVDLG